MIAKAKVLYLRISPRKVRQVADLIRGKSVIEAMGLLSNLNKSATVYLGELLQSAISNAKRKQPDLNLGDLRITKLTVDGGPSMIRYRALSMGRGTMIRRRTSHVNLELFAKDQEVTGKAKKGRRRKKG